MNPTTAFIIELIHFLYPSSFPPPHTILKNAIIAIATNMKEVTTSSRRIIGIITAFERFTAVAAQIFLLNIASTATNAICIKTIQIVDHNTHILHFLRSSSVHCPKNSLNTSTIIYITATAINTFLRSLAIVKSKFWAHFSHVWVHPKYDPSNHHLASSA
jgi:hypothetical protein